MIRTQVYFTKEEREALKEISSRSGKSQSELIRDAVDLLLDEYNEGTWRTFLDKAAGIWSGRKDLPDFEKLRAEFDREGS